MDYVDGELLVNPQKMMDDSFKSCGAFIGFLAGSFLERHYIKYEIPEGSKNLPVLAFVGFMIAFSWKEFLAPATIVAALGAHWGNFVARCIMWFFVVAIWPVIIKKECQPD